MITPDVLEALRNGEEVQIATLDGWETCQLVRGTISKPATDDLTKPPMSHMMVLELLLRRVWRIKPELMNFLEAVAKMKKGAKMRREGWGPNRAKPMALFPTGSVRHCSPEIEDCDLKLEDYEANDWYEVGGE